MITAGDGENGSALLLVVGASAALAALALATLSASQLAYEIATVEYQGELARLLARTGLDLVGAEIAGGALVPPPVGAQATWEPGLPAPPAGLPPLPAGCGFRVVVSRVPTAAAPPPPVSPAPPPELIDAVVEARCGRGLERRAARLAQGADGSLVRLY